MLKPFPPLPPPSLVPAVVVPRTSLNWCPCCSCSWWREWTGSIRILRPPTCRESERVECPGHPVSTLAAPATRVVYRSWQHDGHIRVARTCACLCTVCLFVLPGVCETAQWAKKCPREEACGGASFTRYAWLDKCVAAAVGRMTSPLAKAFIALFGCTGETAARLLDACKRYSRL